MLKKIRRGLTTAAVVGAYFVTTALLPPAGLAPVADDGAITYYVDVEFSDGSSLTVDPATGQQTVDPTDTGAAGMAGTARRTGSLDVIVGPDDGKPRKTPYLDETLDGDSGETPATAGEPQPEDPAAFAGDMSPMAATPNGFHLYGTNTTAYGYIYNSLWLDTKLRACQYGECWVEARVHNKIKEYLYGGSSIRWQMTVTTSFVSGDDEDISVQYKYWCGVNIPNASDITCRTDDTTADSSGTGPYWVSQYVTSTHSSTINKKFGSGHASYAKFPMIEIKTYFDVHDVTVVEKVRGWDIRRYSGVWKMSPVSGTGY